MRELENGCDFEDYGSMTTFKMCGDSSDMGTAASLMQEDIEGIEHCM